MRHLCIKKNKIKVIIVSSICAALLCVTGSLAIFSTGASRRMSGGVGSFDVKSSDFNIKNASKLSPGDGINVRADDSVPKISFLTVNSGSKSVRIRDIITVSFDDSLISSDKIMLSNPKNGFELPNKVYVSSDGKTYSQNQYKSLKAPIKCTAVRYIFQSGILNGTGQNAEIEKASVGSNNSREIYNIGLDPETPWNYQGKSFHVNVTSQFMQCRNTEEKDWTTFFSMSQKA